MKDTLYHTKFLDLKTTKTKNGSNWYYAHRPNANDVVIILPMTKDEVLFLIEERPPMQAENRGKYTIGLAAGLVGDIRVGESIEDAINIELLEETGLAAKNIQIMSRKVASSAGCVSEISTIAIAYIEEKTPKQVPLDDDGVIVDRAWIKKKDIKKWLIQKEEDGYILTAQMLAALYYINE